MTNNDMATDEVQIDLVKLAKELLHKAVYIIAAAFVCMVAAFFLAGRGSEPSQYAATALMRVEYPPLEAESEEELQLLIENSDRDLLNTSIVLLTSRGVLEDVIDREGLSYTYQELSPMITSATSSKNFFRITVTGADADETVRIANALADVLPEKAAALTTEGAVRVVDYAGEALETGGASGGTSGRMTKALLGAIVGAVLAVGVIVFLYLFSNKIHDEDYLAQAYPNVPLLALIPGGKAADKGRGDYYSARASAAAAPAAVKRVENRPRRAPAPARAPRSAQPAAGEPAPDRKKAPPAQPGKPQPAAEDKASRRDRDAVGAKALRAQEENKAPRPADTEKEGEDKSNG